MAPSDPPTTFGASIVPTPQQFQPRSNDDLAAPAPYYASVPGLSPAVSREDLTPTPTHHEKPVPIHSPFYQHPPASFERVPKSSAQLNREKDLEAADVGAHTPLRPDAEDSPFAGKVSIDANKECGMWPSKQTLMQGKAADRKKKRDRKFLGSWTGPVVERWEALEKRQRLWIKIGIAVFCVGVAVAIAVGISASVNGGYYTGKGDNNQIGETD